MLTYPEHNSDPSLLKMVKRVLREIDALLSPLGTSVWRPIGRANDASIFYEDGPGDPSMSVLAFAYGAPGWHPNAFITISFEYEEVDEGDGGTTPRYKWMPHTCTIKADHVVGLTKEPFRAVLVVTPLEVDGQTLMLVEEVCTPHWDTSWAISVLRWALYNHYSNS